MNSNFRMATAGSTAQVNSMPRTHRIIQSYLDDSSARPSPSGSNASYGGFCLEASPTLRLGLDRAGGYVRA